MRNLLIAAVGAVTISALVACSDTPTSSSLSSPDAGLFSAAGDSEAGVKPLLVRDANEEVLVNPTCSDVGFDFGENSPYFEFKIPADGDWPGEGTYIDPETGASFQITTDDNIYWGFEATGATVFGALSKGGPGANFYDYRPMEGIAFDSHLHSPLNPNDRPAGISHVNFCYVPGNNGNGYQGCSQGFWANHDGSGPQDSQWPEHYNPTDDLGDLFDVAGYHAAFGDATLKAALLGGALPNGPASQLDRAANNLFRQAVAAVLNAAHEDVDFEYGGKTGTEAVDAIRTAVNNALAGRDRQEIGQLESQLEALNTAGCPIQMD